MTRRPSSSAPPVRTDDEIISRARQIVAGEGYFFEIGLGAVSELLSRLCPGTVDVGLTDFDAWREGKGRDRKTVLSEMREHMDFAISKAISHRGLSASDSIDYYDSWVWLLGDEDYGAIDWKKYRNYGCPILFQICKKYGFPPIRKRAFQRMARGLCCVPDCDAVCGGKKG